MRSRLGVAAQVTWYQHLHRDCVTSSPSARPGSSRQRQLAEADAAEAEPAQERARAAARPQRLCCRTWNFGFRLLFSIMALRAIAVSLC